MKAAASKVTKIMSISLTPEMSQKVHQIAEEERRSVSEIFREALRRYAAIRDLDSIRKNARKTVKKKGLKPSDVDRIIHEHRRKQDKKRK